jgi:hypothetical protein
VRARTIVVILVVAMGLGLVVGRFVLPARSTLTATPGDVSSPSGSGAPTPKHTTSERDGRRETSAGAGLGTENLLQREDFYQQGVLPVSATVGTAGRQALSACSGEKTMRALTEGEASAYAEEIWTFDTHDILLTESIADTTFDLSADSYETQLNDLVRSCQTEPGGHWYYGKGHSISVKGGAGTWYPSFTGDGGVAGGVAVIRSGRRFGIVELTGQPTDESDYMYSIAAASINRLAD